MRSRRRIVTAGTLLACFVLALVAAVISPLLQAQPLQRVCSADGQWLLLADAGGDQPGPGGAHALDCALCLPAGAPPSALMLAVASVAPAVQPRQLRPHAHAVRVARAPLPARGPPARS